MSLNGVLARAECIECKMGFSIQGRRACIMISFIDSRGRRDGHGRDILIEASDEGCDNFDVGGDDDDDAMCCLLSRFLGKRQNINETAKQCQAMTELFRTVVRGDAEGHTAEFNHRGS